MQVLAALSNAFVVLRINIIYFGNLAQISVNSLTHSFSSQPCDSVRFSPAGGRKTIMHRPSLVQWTHQGSSKVPIPLTPPE